MYKITVTTKKGVTLTYTVDSYDAHDGLVEFKDVYTSKLKAFPVNDCEIEEK